MRDVIADMLTVRAMAATRTGRLATMDDEEYKRGLALLDSAATLRWVEEREWGPVHERAARHAEARADALVELVDAYRLRITELEVWRREDKTNHQRLFDGLMDLVGTYQAEVGLLKKEVNEGGIRDGARVRRGSDAGQRRIARANRADVSGVGASAEDVQRTDDVAPAWVNEPLC